jgi:hypothetical protein
MSVSTVTLTLGYSFYLCWRSHPLSLIPPFPFSILQVVCGPLNSQPRTISIMNARGSFYYLFPWSSRFPNINSTTPRSYSCTTTHLSLSSISTAHWPNRRPSAIRIKIRENSFQGVRPPIVLENRSSRLEPDPGTGPRGLIRDVKGAGEGLTAGRSNVPTGLNA